MYLPPVVAGSITAVTWGTADFVARFTGRALGLVTALFWMLASSAVILSVVAWGMGEITGHAVAGQGSSLTAVGLLLLYGVGIAVATLLLYHALALGPVTIAAPIVGSFPAFTILVAVILGARPSSLQWLAMLIVMAGVVIVVRSAGHFQTEHSYGPGHLKRTVLVSLASAGAFGLSVSAGQEAGAIYGDLQTVCAGRWIGVVVCTGLLLRRRESVTIPLRWWPIVVAQGLLDGVAYVTLLLGSEGAASPVAAVIASTFSAVTVVLARIFIRERMSVVQWLGIAVVIAGVATLSAP